MLKTPPSSTNATCLSPIGTKRPADDQGAPETLYNKTSKTEDAPPSPQKERDAAAYAELEKQIAAMRWLEEKK